MTIARALLLVAISANILLVGFAVPGQTHRKGTARRTKSTSTRTATSLSVKEIDFDGLKSLLSRNASAPRPLLVNFWATWCDPCRDEFPDLVRLDHLYSKRGLEFAAISLDDKSELKNGIPAFLREMHATMPAYRLNADDPEPSILLVDQKWSGALPATVLYDAQGTMVYKHFGRISVAELRAAIEKVLGSGKQSTNH